MPLVKLMTKKGWNELSPWYKGYVLYWQGKLPGSELKNMECPYAPKSQESKEFAAGELQAILDVQDGEE